MSVEGLILDLVYCFSSRFLASESFGKKEKDTLFSFSSSVESWLYSRGESLKQIREHLIFDFVVDLLLIFTDFILLF